MIQVVIEKFKKTISPDTLSRYIIESGQFRIIKGEPMDLNRYEVDDEEMKQYFVDLKNTVDGVPASLVFNMDEAGQDDYIDTHSMQVVVKSTCQDKITQIPLRRESKRATLIHCISADGTYAKPLLIVPRKTLDSVLLQRLTCNNCIVKYQCHGFANTMIIRQWLEIVFFPLIKQKWEIEHQRSQYNGNVILIIDGMSAHAKALQFYNLAQYHLQVIYLVPHSSHLSQSLDLVLFSIQKLFTTRRKLKNSLSTQSDKLRLILKGLQEASSSENIISAFESAGIFHLIPKKQKIDFNSFMPNCIVVMENSRYFKGEKIEIPIDNYRLSI